MNPTADLPTGIIPEFRDIVIETILEVYRANAERHDPNLGDDMATFAFNGYRNSWYRLELALGEAFPDGVNTSRPDNSLLIEFNEYRFHVYRVGPSERIDIHAVPIDGSPTKSSIGESNQLVLNLFGESESPAQEANGSLRDLVIAHAGNPDDHCCAIWIGAPQPVKEPGISPWAWVVQIYRIDRGDDFAGIPIPELGPSHDSREEPDVPLSLRDEDGEGTGAGS